MKQIVVEIKKCRCSYCGEVADTEVRSFQDSDSSSVDSPVCYPCLYTIGLAVAPTCPVCGRELVFVKKERFWGCPEHGKKEIKEFPDSRHFKYKRVQ